MESKDTSKEQNESLINFAYLDELSDDDTEFKISMINQFIDNAPQNITEMRSFCQKKDWNALRGLAHKFKPQLGFMGISSVYGDVEKIERNAEKQTELESIPDLIDNADEITQKAIAQLREELVKLNNAV